MLCFLYLILCCIVPAISSEDCVDLWTDGGTVGDNLQIPEGYSLRDQLTVTGEILEGTPGKRYFVGFVKSSSLEYTMYTTLSPKGKLVVKTSQHDDVLKIDGQVTPGVNNSLLLRMICNETTCSVTSPGDLNVESFNHQQTLPDLLSTDGIRVMANDEYGEILNVHSITFCKATEPDTEKGDRNRDSGGDESGGDEPGTDESRDDESRDDESRDDESGDDESGDEPGGDDSRGGKSGGVSCSEPLRITSPVSQKFSSLPATFSWRIEGYLTNELQLQCNAGEITKTTNETDEPPSRLFYLELPTELDLDLVYCEIVNNVSLVQQFVLTKSNFFAADQFNDLCFPGSTTKGKFKY